MNKFTLNFRKYLKIYIISFVASFLIGVAIFIIYFFVKNHSLLDAVNAATISFISLLGVGVLAWVVRSGMFDSLSYGFSQMFTSMFSKKPNKYNDFNAYREDRITKRQSTPNIYLAIIFASLLFGIITLVLFIVFKTQNIY